MCARVCVSFLRGLYTYVTSQSISQSVLSEQHGDGSMASILTGVPNTTYNYMHLVRVLECSEWHATVCTYYMHHLIPILV